MVLFDKYLVFVSHTSMIHAITHKAETRKKMNKSDDVTNVNLSEIIKTKHTPVMRSHM